MQSILGKSATSLALAASFLGMATWSTASYGCAQEPVLSSVCIMAWNWSGGFNNTYVPADGRKLAPGANTALFSLIGATYGGDGSTSFQLPDLRGRVVIGGGDGSASGLPVYSVGQKGGSHILKDLPQHAHTLNGTAAKAVTVTTTLGNMAATTTLTGLTATTTLNGVTASVDGSKLTLKASSGGSFSSSPGGRTLGAPSGATASKIYSDASPSVAMQAGSIGGSAPVTFNGAPTTTLAGTPSTTLSGTPSVVIGGATDPSGSSQPVSLMPPYLVMNYFIAIQGLYPVRD